jgi:Flp pilus assembly protein TadG
MNKRRRSLGKGQAIVELALVFSLFILIILVIFDLGRAIYFYSAIHNAAQEGARYGITHPGDVAGAEEAARHLTAGLTIDPVATYFTDNVTDDEKVTVRVEYQFTPVTLVLKILTGSDTITLTSQATMFVEQ